MYRPSALFAAAALALSAFVVPATAHADATGVTLKVDFDNLAKDRVAKLTLNAKSASGVTSVRANMHYQTPDAEPYASVEFTRVSGTDNDGVWEAEFRPDIQARPGLTRVEVLVTTADGATITRPNGFYDCYSTLLEDVTATPGVVDIENSDLTVRGRVMIQKDRDSAPEPAPDVEVRGPTYTTPDGDMTSPKVTSGADGSFTMSYSGVASASATVLRRGAQCGASEDAPLTVNMQSTETTATVTPGLTVGPYTHMSVDGKVVRHGSTGPAPAAGIDVRVNVPAALVDLGTLSAKTRSDGTFHTFFTAAREAGTSGAVTVRSAGSGFLTPSQAGLGTLNIRNISEITDFNAFPEPLAYGDSIVVNGQLTVKPDFTNSTNLPVYLEYSMDGKTWRTWQTRTMARPGNVYFTGDKPVTKDAYWRVRYPGSALNTPAVTWADYVDVKYRTQMYNFNASPEPVKKGATITVKGLLHRFRDVAGPAPGANIHIYFRPKGSSTWTKMAITKTASNGWFKKTFKASEDGTWMARYWEGADYLGSNYPNDYVDVT